MRFAGRAALKGRATRIGMSRIGMPKVGMSILAVVAPLLLVAQAFRPAFAQPQNPNAVANFVKVTAPVIALMHVRVIHAGSLSHWQPGSRRMSSSSSDATVTSTRSR